MLEAALMALAAAASDACQPIDDKRAPRSFESKLPGSWRAAPRKSRCTGQRQTDKGTLMSAYHVKTTINGDPVEFVCEAEEALLDVLRDRLGLTGAKEGCGTGDCGACSIMLDDRLVCSCLVLGPRGARAAHRDHRRDGAARRFASLATQVP
jgi:hypothetical protein